jgi:hypothetical protein
MRLKDQIVPIYSHKQSHLKRATCVAELQQCDIYATVLVAIQP